MNFKIGKWDYEKHEYDDYELPKGCYLTTRNMDADVACAECGIIFKFGNCYTSKRVHALPTGFGFPVCEKCYEDELTLEKKYKN